MTMYPLAMSIKKILVMLCMILYAVDQAFSLKCYVCRETSKSPNPDSDCFINPTKKEFEQTCKTSSSSDASASLFFGSALSSALQNSSAVKGQKAPYALDDFDCLKLIGSKKNEKGIMRMCLSKTMSDHAVESLAKIEGYSVDFLGRCDTDFCNSSGILSVGLLSLMSPLTLLFFAKL